MTLPESVATILREASLKTETSPFGAKVTVPGAKAFALWRRLAEASRGNGVWPVIVGAPANIAELVSRRDATEAAPADETLEYAKHVDLESALEMEGDAPAAEDFGGDWPDTVTQPKEPVCVRRDDGKGYLDRVVIVLVPAAEAWHVPAHFGFGNWNDCPEPSVHVARHREWQTEFGAEICAVTPDTIECVVARPPADKEAAIALAVDQFVYAYDIVAQGTESIEALAAILLGGPLWFFWWD